MHAYIFLLLLLLPCFQSIFSTLEASTLAVDATVANSKLFFSSVQPLPPEDIDPENPFAVMDEMSHNRYVNTPGMGPEGIPFNLQDAIVYTLENQVALALTYLNIEVQKGVLQRAAGPFDYYLDTDATYIDKRNRLNYPSKSSKRGDETIVQANVTKLTRPGTSFRAAANVDKVNNPFANPSTFNNGSLSFFVQQPLLRGFLNGILWMQEQAAQYSLYASYYDDFQRISQSIYDTTVAYWEAVGAQNALEIQQVGTRRIMEIADKVNELIRNNQLPRSAFYQSAQQESQQLLALISATEEVYRTVQELRRIMGDVSVEDMDDIMLDLTDDFAIQPLDTVEFQKNFKDYFQYALRYNYDIQASTLRQIEAAYLLKGADNEMLPELDVIGGVTNLNFTKGEEAKEVFSPLSMHRPQTDWSISINLNVPLYNDAAIGNYKIRKAQYAQTMLNTQLLEQNKLQDLRNALSEHITVYLRFQEANKKVEISQIVFDNSSIQFRAGLMSLFDLLAYESALTIALLQRNEIRTLYMQNVALIRFLTASTFLQGEDNHCIEILDITTLPEFNLNVNDRPKISERMENFLQRRNKVWKKR